MHLGGNRHELEVVRVGKGDDSQMIGSKFSSETSNAHLPSRTRKDK
jgi:hypothetical protein